jgi:hypothetical protein
LLAEPADPEHVSVNVFEEAVSGPVLADPDVGFVPDQTPLAVHDVAFAEDHVRLEDPPLATLRGLAVSCTVTGGGAAAPTETLDRASAATEPRCAITFAV